MKNQRLSITQVAAALELRSTKAVYALLDRNLLSAKRDNVFNRLYVESSELDRYKGVRRGRGAPKKKTAESENNC